MTEPTPEETRPPDGGVSMPRWVPVLIGGLLVVLASLAVYTGLRYRDTNTLTAHVPPRRERTTTPAPPGEPEAGASLVLPGSAGENTPVAHDPVQGRARAVITGGPQGVASTVRMWARRGMVLDVMPEDAMVYVNNLPIGQARQFNTSDEIYDFAQPGSYTIRIVAPGGKEKSFVVTAADDAQQDVAKISAKLE